MRETSDLTVIINFLLPTLTEVEKRIATYILHYGDKVADMTTSNFAKSTKTSEASIIRFCRELGFSGFAGLKNHLKINQKSSFNSDKLIERINADDTMSEIMQKVFFSNIKVLKDTLNLVTEEYDTALNILENANKIHFFGVGDAHAICKLSFMKFYRYGISGSAYSDITMQLLTANSMSQNDVAIFVSNEGRSKSLIEVAKIVKTRSAKIICVTELKRSPLIKLADVGLFTVVNDLSVGKEEITRRVADQAILDSLFFGLKVRRNSHEIDYYERINTAISKNKT